MTHQIIALGEVLFDDYGAYRHLGGAAANFAAHAAQLGETSCLYSAVGHDPDGAEILNLLHEFNVKCDFMQQVDFPTGKVLVKMNGSSPEYEIVKNSAWDNMEYREIPPCDAVYFGSLAQRSPRSRATIRKILMESNAFKIFDINLRQDFYSKEILKWSLEQTDLLKLNDEELPVLAAMFDLPFTQEDFLRQVCRQFNISIAVVTLGKNGSTAYADGQILSCPVPPAKVINTVGAGDAFCAAFVSSLLNSEPLETAQRKANQRAAWVCAHHEAIPS